MVSMAKVGEVYRRSVPFILVIFLQVGLSGMDIISKVALNDGMNSYVFAVYRNVLAAVVMTPFAILLDRERIPAMTRGIFVKLLFLGLLQPVITQNLYVLGMKATTATFAVSMSNLLPAMTFFIAWILRLEVVNLKSLRSQAKIGGTIATVAGAMIMTLVKGPHLDLFSSSKTSYKNEVNNGVDLSHCIKGGIMLAIACLSWSGFMVLQAITLKSYPAELALTVWICFLGAVEGTILGFAMERGNLGIWAIKWNSTLFATVYCGIVCSGFAYYIQGVLMRMRGPVFVTAFSPLAMLIVAVVGAFMLGEKAYLGRVFGAIVIVVGLYLVVWGKSKDHKLSSPEHLSLKRIAPLNHQMSLLESLRRIAPRISNRMKFVLLDRHE